ncbi:DUF6185 family protein [Streptomyces sp. SID8352]|uniref:DUF6185 family protein n=1 Tax=Streptomyces sp. SID8352 TaxID=2690338 RepID=UPI0019257A58
MKREYADGGRWMRRALLLLVFTGLLLAAGGWGAPASYAADDCHTKQLRTARVTTSVRLKHDGENYSRAETQLSVQVPKSWKPARNLLLNGDTERYRAAMRCVLRYPGDLYPYRDTEGRPWAPRVTVQEKWITVDQVAVTYVDDRRDRDFGPWRITVGKRYWTLALTRPPALDHSWWQRITVDLGGRAARSVSPTPTEGSATHLVWTRPKAGGRTLDVVVEVQPPATKALATRWNEKPWYLARSVAWMAWDLTLFGVLLYLVRVLRRSPVSSVPTPAETATRRNLLLWSCLTAGVVLVFELDDQMPSLAGDYGVLSWWPEHRAAIHLMLAACGGAALCFFGRPRAGAVAAVVAATAYPVAVAVVPERFGLPANIWLHEDNIKDVQHLRDTHGFLWLAVACGCVAFVWMVATLAAAQRLRLAPRLTSSGASQRGRFPWWALPACAALSAALVALGLWATRNAWKQETWLSTAGWDPYYDRWRLAYVANQGLAWFPSTWPDWFPLWTGWLTGMAMLLAVLAARSAAPGAARVAPRMPDSLVLAVFFVAMVAPSPGWYVGLPAPLLSVPPVLAAWWALLALGRRRSVLGQELVPGTPLRAVIKESDRRWLIESARKYRDLHSQLRQWEQGDRDGERAELETKLDKLHRWNPDDTASPYSGDPLPASVDAVELALAWGPRATWWLNARRAAILAAVLALPATGVAFWADRVRGPLWSNMTREQFGIAGLVEYVIASEAIWAAAGFVLGALWRVLPGRRGPAKALGLGLVYAAPVALHWVVTRALGESFGTWALDVALTVLVLTSTGVAMDIGTFRQEDHYWPTRMTLLLSIYQLRTASVQLAFFVAQLVALVGVWQQLKGNDPTVLIQPQPPTGTQGGPPEGGTP